MLYFLFVFVQKLTTNTWSGDHDHSVKSDTDEEVGELEQILSLHISLLLSITILIKKKHLDKTWAICICSLVVFKIFFFSIVFCSFFWKNDFMSSFLRRILLRNAGLSESISSLTEMTWKRALLQPTNSMYVLNFEFVFDKSIRFKFQFTAIFLIYVFVSF